MSEENKRFFKLMREVDVILYGRAICSGCVEETENYTKYVDDKLVWYCRKCGHNTTSPNGRFRTFKKGVYLVVGEGEYLKV